MKKVEELKDLGCSVRGRFYDLAWSKPVLRAPAVHGVSSLEGSFFMVHTFGSVWRFVLFLFFKMKSIMRQCGSIPKHFPERKR